MAVWYCGSTKHAAVAQWAANTVYGAGAIVRQLAAPAVGSERCFRTALGGTSHATTEPVWVLTQAAAQPVDGTVADWVEVTGNSSWGWTAPGARLVLFLTATTGWAAAGDTVYVSHSHAETQAAAMTLTSRGTAAAPVYVLCVDDAATPPTTLAMTATVSATGASSITFNQYVYCYGITFTAASGASNGDILFGSSSTALPVWWRLENCRLALETTASRAIYFGYGHVSGDDQLVELINTPLQFGAVGQSVSVRCPLVWRNTANAIAGTVPTTLFVTPSGLCGAWINLDGVDLSAAGAGKNLISVAGSSFYKYTLQNCKLGTNLTLTTGTHPGQGGTIVEFIRCASGATNYDYYYQDYQGTITQETTIVRTGGASDGTTPISRKMVSSAGSKFDSPLVLDCITVWNETTGSALTATVEVITDNVTLTDAEAWVEVEYLGSAATPISSFVHDRAADIMATPANQAASTATWTTTGLGTPVTQKFVSPAFTPNMKGPIKVRVMLAKASTTMYACPKVTVA